jgi:hypothetical protein
MGRILGILFSKFLGLVIFLVMLLILNLILPYFPGTVLPAIVSFFNAHILDIILMSVVIGTAEILYALIFPISLLAPPVAAIGAVLVVRFILLLFGMLDSALNISIQQVFAPFILIIYILVFLIVLIVGYIKVFSRIFRPRARAHRHGIEPRHRHVRKVRHDDEYL